MPVDPEYKLPVSSVLQAGYSHPLLRSWSNQGRGIQKDQLVYPLFITDDPDESTLIPTLPGQYRWGVNKLKAFLDPLIARGLKSVILFGVPLRPDAGKDYRGTPADVEENGTVVPAAKLLRSLYPELYVMADVCLCEYTSHGHCGLLNEDGTVHSGKSVARLIEVCLNYAKAGVQCLAPSDMTDGRILGIKTALVENGWGGRVCLMSYSAKFSSNMYGPFRDAAGSAPSFGNRKCYQLPTAARGLARRAITRDMNEGADIIMVKPALHYLDVISDAATMARDYPIATYHVSGEYAMLIAGSNAGVYELKPAAFEVLSSLTRAGASIIITYLTPKMLTWLDEPRQM